RRTPDHPWRSACLGLRSHQSPRCPPHGGPGDGNSGQHGHRRPVRLRRRRTLVSPTSWAFVTNSQPIFGYADLSINLSARTMSDPYPTTEANAIRAPKPNSKSLLDRILSVVRREPEDREDIKALLDAAHDRDLLDVEAYGMLKGALAVSERTVADIMVPRSRMDLLDVSLPLPELLTFIIDAAHSRFPVY